MASQFVTRSGLTPNEKELPFTITTVDAEKFLQEKVDIIVSEMTNKGEKQEHVDVSLYTTDAGSKFIPFVILLPLTVLQDRNQGKRNRDEAAIFNPKDSDRTANMKQPFYNFFKSFVYSKDDEKAFMSPDWKRGRGVTTNTSYILKSMRVPKVHKMDGGKTLAVTFLIDPMRLFHAMLMIDGSNADFFADICDWRRQETGKYAYDVKRSIIKKNGKQNRSKIIDEINRHMRQMNRQ